MSDVAARIAAASGDAGKLLALAIELANENARLAGHAAALEEAETERKRAQAEKKRRQRHGVSRDVPGQSGTGGDRRGQPPSPPSVSLLPPTPPNNSSSPPTPPAPSGAAAPTKRARNTRPATPWMGAMQRAWIFGTLPPGSATLLQPVVAAVGEDEAGARLTRYCRATDAKFASVRDFVAKHAAHATDGRPASPTDQAAALWTRYRDRNLLTRWDRAEYERIGGQLIAAGDYPSLDAFFAELRVTQPWTLANARTDGWAVQEIASRLAHAHAGAA